MCTKLDIEGFFFKLLSLNPYICWLWCWSFSFPYLQRLFNYLAFHSFDYELIFITLTMSLFLLLWLWAYFYYFDYELIFITLTMSTPGGGNFLDKSFSLLNLDYEKKAYKQWWATISPISTKWTMTWWLDIYLFIILPYIKITT
jgi:hypothetical protein